MFQTIVFNLTRICDALGEAVKGNLTPEQAAMHQSKLLGIISSLSSDHTKKVRESPHIPCDTEYQVFSWFEATTGMLVTRSDHWYEQRCQKKPKVKEIGILTDKSFFEDSKRRVTCHPTVCWEGQGRDHMVHPMNIKPYHDNHTLSMVIMDDGQWGTYGPPNKQDK
jgi:hypothetical protein